MIAPRYLRWLIAAGGGWLIFYLCFTLVINPYGISPVDVTIPHINRYKPKSVDIDRHTKPVEVWMNQPKTVFLGTSRIHQSIDPSLLDGTEYAPAYNASVPAVALSMNASYLEIYKDLDPSLQNAFVELFFYNFLGQGQGRTPVTKRSIWESALTLAFSLDSFRDSATTALYNLAANKPAYEVKKGGFFYYPPGHPAAAVFSGFPDGMWDLYKNSPGGYKLHEPAFEALREIIELADEKGIVLTLIATPNHAYFDYFVDLVDAWDLVEEWLKRITEMAPVYSFAQPNDWTYEPVESGMKYWNDPFHFSLEMGRGIQTAFLGKPLPGRPDNFMALLTPDKIHAHVEERKRAIRAWAQQHPEFVEQFEVARNKAGL
jgi:hypothetical protein